MIYEIVITNKAGTAQTFCVDMGSAPSATSASKSLDATRVSCRVDGEDLGPDFDALALALAPEVLSLLLAGESYEIRRDVVGTETQITVRGERFTVEVRDPRSLRARRSRSGASDGPKKIIAPMPGKVIRILARENTAVEAGQGVIVIEAMKMQNELKSPKTGVVKKIMVSEGATVNPGDALAIIE